MARDLHDLISRHYDRHESPVATLELAAITGLTPAQVTGHLTRLAASSLVLRWPGADPAWAPGWVHPVTDVVPLDRPMTSLQREALAALKGQSRRVLNIYVPGRIETRSASQRVLAALERRGLVRAMRVGPLTVWEITAAGSVALD
jgi:DNA-binding transcriptional ArsR family regulator